MIEKIKKNNHMQTLDDKKISIAIMSSFVILIIQYLVLILYDLMGTSKGLIVQSTSKVLVGFFYLLALPSVLKKSKIKFFGLYFICFFIFIFNYAFFYENRIYLKSIIFPLFFTCLPSFIYAYSINDWDVLMKVIEKTSIIVFIVGSITGILAFLGKVQIGQYSMSLSYYMLLPNIIYMNKFLDRISLKSSVILGISLLVILALGSRGAIMCIGVFIILKLIRKLKHLTYSKLLMFIILFSIIIFGLIFLDEIQEFIYNFLLINFGIRSRSIYLFLQDEIHLSGRDILYRIVIEETMKKPFIGLGLTGDRFILQGGYVHNLLIEILSNFGLVIGTILIVFVIFFLIKALFIKDTKKYNMIIIWLSLGFVHLFVSGTYLTDLNFWIMLGLNFKLLFSKNIKE